MLADGQGNVFFQRVELEKKSVEVAIFSLKLGSCITMEQIASRESKLSPSDAEGSSVKHFQKKLLDVARDYIRNNICNQQSL